MLTSIPALLLAPLLLCTLARLPRTAAVSSRFTILDPTPATIWTSSAPVTIAWSFDPTDAGAATSTLRIDLYLAVAGHLASDRVIATIAGAVPASAKSIAWTAPDVGREAVGGFYVRVERNKEKTGIAAWFEGRDVSKSGGFRIVPSEAATPTAAPTTPAPGIRIDASGTLVPTPTDSSPTPVVTVQPTVTVVECHEQKARKKCIALGRTYAGNCACGAVSGGARVHMRHALGGTIGLGGAAVGAAMLMV